MGANRQLALDLQQDIATSPDTSCVTKRLADKPTNEIEQICSLEIDGRTVFQTIAAHDRAEILEKIISFGVNINRVDRFAVHVAISQKAVNVMKILLSHKANIDCATEEGKTPLHIASELGYIKIVRELLENGAKPMLNQPEKTGCTPLSLACMTDHRETATCLMIYGAAVNFEGGFPPLHTSSLMGYLSLVRMLLDRGAYVDLRDLKGETALHYAAYKSHKQIVQLLLQRGAKVACFDGRGKTPLDLVTDDEIKRLLENKLKTDSNANLKGRRDSGPKKHQMSLDTIPHNVSQPEVGNTIKEEEEDLGRLEKRKSSSQQYENGIDLDHVNGKHESCNRGDEKKQHKNTSNDPRENKRVEEKCKQRGNDEDREYSGKGTQKYQHRDRDSTGDKDRKEKCDTERSHNSNKTNVNHNNSTEEGAVGGIGVKQKKVSAQSTFSTDSETGERRKRSKDSETGERFKHTRQNDRQGYNDSDRHLHQNPAHVDERPERTHDNSHDLQSGHMSEENDSLQNACTDCENHETGKNCEKNITDKGEDNIKDHHTEKDKKKKKKGGCSIS